MVALCRTMFSLMILCKQVLLLYMGRELRCQGRYVGIFGACCYSFLRCGPCCDVTFVFLMHNGPYSFNGISITMVCKVPSFSYLNTMRQEQTWQLPPLQWYSWTSSWNLQQFLKYINIFLNIENIFCCTSLIKKNQIILYIPINNWNLVFSPLLEIPSL